ncbi:MAK10-like protein [Tanacetum coccineum]
MEGSYYSFPCLILSTRKDRKTSQRYPDVPTTSRRISIRSMDSPIPQPQALGTTFEDRVRDYMATHTERMERFENTIFKQREEISDRMAEMFGLLKEFTTSRAPEKVLIREEAKSPVTKNVNSISLTRGEEEKNDDNDVVIGDDIKKTTGTEMEVSVKEAETKHEAKNKTKNKFNDSLSGTRFGKIKGRTYNLLPRGPVYEAILRKKITRKEYTGGNFEIPCNIGGLKPINALVDQGSDVNVMPLSTYMKLTDERPLEMDIRLFLASHSYIYPLGISKDVLVEVAEHVYPVDFIILDIKENEKRPFILETPFLTTAKVVIKFDKGTITLRSGKTPTMTVNRPVLEWEEKIKPHQEKEMEFDLWRNKNFKNERPAPVKLKDGMDDE